MTSLPMLGAAMTVDELETWRDWLIEGRRDLELQSFIEAETLNGDWMPLVARARRLLDGYEGRLGIHGPFWGFSIASEDPDVRALVARRLDQGLAVCEALGATQMVIHSPYTTWSHNNLDSLPGARERLSERVHDTLRDAVRRAEGIGCTMVIENIEDKDPAVRVALAESFASPAVAVSLDTGHAHYAHGSTGAPPVDFYVTAAGNRLQHVHIQDADGYADRHWEIGKGTVNWHAVFGALARLESRPRLILELRHKAAIPASVAWLKAAGLAQ